MGRGGQQPLARYVTWNATTTREARELALAGFPGLLRFSFFDRGKQHLSSAKVALGALEFSTVRSSGHDIWLADEDNLAVLFPIAGTIEVARKQQARVAKSPETLIVGVGERRTKLSPNYLGVLLKLPTSAVRARIEQLAQSRSAVRLDGPGFPGGGGLADTVRSYLLYLMRELDESERLLQFKPGVDAVNALLIDLVAGHWLDFPNGKARSTHAPAPWQLRRAEAFMHANAARAISMGEVADQVGVSLRALQLAFRKYRQTTPHGFLLECRLREVRQRLCNPQPGDTVATVLLSVGAGHLGRFAHYYLLRFGERPSETLNRGLREL